MKMKSVFIDFFILVSITALLLGSIYFINRLLYPQRERAQKIQLEIGPIDPAYSDSLSDGDIVYDTITKRRIGHITSVEGRLTGKELYMTVTVYAERLPRTRALRTPSLWFEFNEIILEDSENSAVESRALSRKNGEELYG